MNILFASHVAQQEHRNWERAFNKQAGNQPARASVDLLKPFRSILATVTEAFSLPAENLAGCQLSPSECG